MIDFPVVGGGGGFLLPLFGEQMIDFLVVQDSFLRGSPVFSQKQKDNPAFRVRGFLLCVGIPSEETPLDG